MDVERLPSGKFETNELVLELAVPACNILGMIGQETIVRRWTKTKHKVRPFVAKSRELHGFRIIYKKKNLFTLHIEKNDHL